jgi:rod shape-determining protein MreB
MAILSKDLGIDLGTVNIRTVEGSRVIIDEPTIAAIVVAEQKMVAWGKEALDMLGRVPDSIEVTRPMRNGVIADYEVAEYILRDLLKKVGGPLQLLKPQIMITIPDGATSVERRAVHEAALQAG